MGALKFQLNGCRAIGQLPRGVRVFEGKIVAGRIEGDDVLLEFWRLFVKFQPENGAEYTPYEGDKTAGLRQTVGLQDDIPKRFREAALA